MFFGGVCVCVSACLPACLSVRPSVRLSFCACVWIGMCVCSCVGLCLCVCVRPFHVCVGRGGSHVLVCILLTKTSWGSSGPSPSFVWPTGYTLRLPSRVQAARILPFGCLIPQQCVPSWFYDRLSSIILHRCVEVSIKQSNFGLGLRGIRRLRLRGELHRCRRRRQSRPGSIGQKRFAEMCGAVFASCNCHSCVCPGNLTCAACQTGLLCPLMGTEESLLPGNFSKPRSLFFCAFICILNVSLSHTFCAVPSVSES